MNEQTIDERAESARGQLRTAAAARPIPSVGRVTAAAAPSGRRRGSPLGWRPVLAIGVAVAACAVGVAVVLRDDGSVDRQPAGGVPDARRVIDDLPEGFVPSGAFGPGEGIDVPSPNWAAWWIADPTLTRVAMVMPTAAADTSNPMFNPDYPSDGMTAVTIDGHDARLFDAIEQSVEGMRMLVVRGDTEWYTVAARGVADAVLIEMAQAALDDTVTTNEVPSGFELLGAAPLFWSMVSTPTGEGEGLPTGLCGVGYQRSTTSADGRANLDAVVLTTSPDTRMATAQLALYFPGRVQMPGTAYSSLDWPYGGSAHILAWQIGGVSYLMMGTVSIDDLVTAADSVRVATDDEWTSLVALLDANANGYGVGGVERPSVSASATTIATG